MSPPPQPSPPAPSPPPKEQQLEIKTTKYENLIPISKTDYDALKSWIAKDRKLHYPILLNQHGDVLDGHNRLKICKELNIEPRFEVIPFDNDLLEERFVRMINVNRRHMNDFQKAEQALALEPIESKLALQRELAGKPLSPNEPRGRVKEIVSKAVNLPPTTYFRAKTIMEKGSEEVKKRLREGKTEITTEYNDIMKAQKRIKARADAEVFAKTLNLPDKVILLNKDSTNIEELTEIPDNSVDLIVTDPPYSSDSLPLYQGLARLASKKLKDGGSVVFFYGRQLTYDIIGFFKEQGFTNYWDFSVLYEGNGDVYWSMKVVIKHKPMLWFVKGTKARLTTNTLIDDVIQSSKPDKDKHPWAQSTVEAEYIIKNLTISEHSLVVDPFLGAGTFAIPAVKLGRYFIGIELDKDSLENARNNIILETTSTTTTTKKEEEREEEEEEE
jgi:DNA modification methylase/ParB-like chromosome segregation protein Spo0J